MRLRDIMSRYPLTAAGDDTSEVVERLIEAGRIHHVPLIEEDRAVGVWVATTRGLELKGPEAVMNAPTDADCAEALEALIAGQEAVVVWEEGTPVGVLTRTNAVNLIRLGLAHGLGRRHHHPTVLRLVGPAESGKSTLLMRTVPLLEHLRAGVVITDEGRDAAPPDEDLGGVRVLHAPGARWQKGLYECIEQLSEAQVVLIEDSADLPHLGAGAMDDLLVLVVPAGRERQIAPARLREAQAVMLTRLDRAPEGFSPDEAGRWLRAVNPRLQVFGTAALDDDVGLADWAGWIQREVLHRQH